MTRAIDNKSEFSPNEKGEQPLGKKQIIRQEQQTSFAISKELHHTALTTVSDNKDNSHLLSSEQEVQECDVPQCCGISLRSTRDDDSSNTAWQIKIFLN